MESKLADILQNTVSYQLLIEPVWNRNRIYWLLQKGTSSSFNRTSMESKRASRQRDIFRKIFLLIEPVWNRNRVQPVWAATT